MICHHNFSVYFFHGLRSSNLCASTSQTSSTALRYPKSQSGAKTRSLINSASKVNHALGIAGSWRPTNGNNYTILTSAHPAAKWSKGHMMFVLGAEHQNKKCLMGLPERTLMSYGTYKCTLNNQNNQDNILQYLQRPACPVAAAFATGCDQFIQQCRVCVSSRSAH